MDDEYLDKMAQQCGWQATLVYMSICRHIDKKTQSCFPSILRMAKQHRVSRSTIFKGVAALKKRGIIQIEKKKTLGGKWLNNTYILMDKNSWNYDEPVCQADVPVVIPESVSDTNPCLPNEHGGVREEDSKETHGNETHHKETASFLQNEGVLLNGNVFGKESMVLPKDGSGKKGQLVDIFEACSAKPEVDSVTPQKLSGAELNRVIRLFEPILPGDFVPGKSALEKLPTRNAVESLLKSKGADWIAETIWRYYKGRQSVYRPKVGTVYEFCGSQLGKIVQFVTTAEECMDFWDQTETLTVQVVQAQEQKDRREQQEIAEWVKENT